MSPATLPVVPPPPAGGPAVVFAPPPGWTPPVGFDPRRGHLVDPAWPSAPDGWQFWVPAPRPRGALAVLQRGWWGLIVVAVVAVVVGALAMTSEPGSPTEGVGSCWAGTGLDEFESVDCSSERAEYRIDMVVSTPDACPVTSPGYFDDTGAIECLTPVD